MVRFLVLALGLVIASPAWCRPPPGPEPDPAIKAWFESLHRDSDNFPLREAVSLPGSCLSGLKWAEAEQCQPVRMALAGHQLLRAFAGALGTAAAHETPMVQEELQQVQI